MVSIVAGNEEQNKEHDEQFDTDQHHSDAHAGFERNLVNGIGFAGERGKGSARVRESVDANAEPSDAITAGDADEAEGEDDDDACCFHVLEHAEVKQDDDCDKYPKQKDEFSLGDEIGFASLVDQFGDLAHGAMHRQVFEAHIDDHAEAESENTKENADEEQAVSVNGSVEKTDRGKIGKFERSFTTSFRLSES